MFKPIFSWWTGLSSLPAIYLEPNYGGSNEDNGDLLQKILCMHCYTQCPNPAAATTDPCLCWRCGHSQASLIQSLFGSLLLLLGPGAQGSICALQESISHFCVSSGSSMLGLMVISSKKTYAIPKSAAPRAPVPAAVHCWPVPPQEMLRDLSWSLWGRWVLVCTRFVWALWASLMGMGFYSKHESAHPTILLRLFLCPWT